MKETVYTFKAPTIEEVDFEIHCLDEDIPIEGNASAIDEKTDKQIVKNIRQSLASGNRWAWCTVEVKAKFRGFEGSDYLGACSYKSQKDFEKGGYLPQMKEAAFEALLAEIDRQLKPVE